MQPEFEAKASTALQKFYEVDIPQPSVNHSELNRRIPHTSSSRLDLNRLSQDSSAETFLYLAYGSNLSAETFKGKRGIKPLSAVNVHVPSLDLTFDLPGIPYIEPCFANSKYRHIDSPLSPPESADYHKTRWHKGLVGVVYEVTAEDYRTIIATEGGGASYEDVIVPCYVLPEGSKTVDASPNGVPFQAHTLLCPLNNKDKNRIARPDPNYAQASARYLKLITDGAEEHHLPDEYIAYLYDLRAYTLTTSKQKVAQLLMVTLLVPIVMALFAIGKVLADKNGKIPGWLLHMMGLIFKLTWKVYDGFLKGIFGDGERTMQAKRKPGDNDGEDGLERLLDEKKGLLEL